MEIIELTGENINQYLESCIETHKFLLRSDESINEDQIRATASEPSNYFAAAVEGGRVVGLGVVNIIVHPVRTNTYIDNIVVHPDFRGRGFFTAIMNALEERSRDWGAEGVKLTCGRAEVQPLYEKRGYKEKVNTKYYVKKF